MTVTAPSRPPRQAEPAKPGEQEALIKEARRRARLRRMRNGAAAVVAAAIAIGTFAAWHAGRNGTNANAAAKPTPLPMPKPVPLRPPPRNAQIAAVKGNDLVALRPDGPGARTLTACPGKVGDCNFGTFSWSPDGRMLAFLAGPLRRRDHPGESLPLCRRGRGLSPTAACALRRLQRVPAALLVTRWTAGAVLRRHRPVHRQPEQRLAAPAGCPAGRSGSDGWSRRGYEWGVVAERLENCVRRSRRAVYGTPRRFRSRADRLPKRPFRPEVVARRNEARIRRRRLDLRRRRGRVSPEAPPRRIFRERARRARLATGRTPDHILLHSRQP